MQEKKKAQFCAINTSSIHFEEEGNQLNSNIDLDFQKWGERQDWQEHF